GYVLGTGNIANARFIYNNMTDGLRWTQVWYYNNQEVTRFEATWSLTEGEASANGSREIALESGNGLPPGRYRLALYIENELSALSDFTIAGATEAAYPRVFSETRFVIADTPTEALSARPVTTFTSTVERLYAVFKWEQLANGTLWRMRWSVDGTVFFDELVPWDNPQSGDNYLTELTGPNGVPDGTYRVELLIDNIVLQAAEIEIGIGQLAIDPFTRAEGVQLTGQVVDADTRAGIADLTVIIISDQFSVEDYTAQLDQVYALATTDRNGRFQVDRPLQFDAPYSLLIAADGYLPIPADGVEVTATTPNPLVMTIYLTRG
ncbi:MAG: carboxypeptidase regulatory-like domain-containing protein, partial [Armatimonadetes bacterium]|nr:carboxypeptidase regulatory-like domain-containing protein [Anaerolineae bacterium]